MSTLYYDVLKDGEISQTIELQSKNDGYDLIIEEERDSSHYAGYKYDQILVSLTKEQMLELKKALNNLDL